MALTTSSSSMKSGLSAAPTNSFSNHLFNSFGHHHHHQHQSHHHERWVLLIFQRSPTLGSISGGGEGRRRNSLIESWLFPLDGHFRKCARAFSFNIFRKLNSFCANLFFIATRERQREGDAPLSDILCPFHSIPFHLLDCIAN